MISEVEPIQVHDPLLVVEGDKCLWMVDVVHLEEGETVIRRELYDTKEHAWDRYWNFQDSQKP